MAALGIAHQCADSCLVDGDIDRIKSADDFIGDGAGLLFAADTDIAAEPQFPREPGQKQDGCD